MSRLNPIIAPSTRPGPKARKTILGKGSKTYRQKARARISANPMEDEMLGRMSEAAKQEGFSSIEDAEDLLDRLKHAQG